MVALCSLRKCNSVAGKKCIPIEVFGDLLGPAIWYAPDLGSSVSKGKMYVQPAVRKPGSYMIFLPPLTWGWNKSKFRLHLSMQTGTDTAWFHYLPWKKAGGGERQAMTGTASVSCKTYLEPEWDKKAEKWEKIKGERIGISLYLISEILIVDFAV